MILTEAKTGRRYQLVKRWDPQGKFMSPRDMRRYSLWKVFI